MLSLAWCVVFFHVLSVASLQTAQPEGSEVDAAGWDDDDDANETYYQGSGEKKDEFQLKNMRKRLLRDPCSDCLFVADLRCHHKSRTRSGFYHRLADCLVPAYGLLERGRHLLNFGRGKKCIVTSTNPSVMFPAFNSVVGIEEFEVIEEKHPCVEKLSLTTIDARSVKGAEDWYKRDFPEKMANVGAVLPIDYKANMMALHRDVAKIATPIADASIVLMVRHTSTRAFTRQTAIALRTSIEGLASTALIGSSSIRPQYAEYHGLETLKQTLDIFVNARGIVGYHGAGLVNALFAKEKSCIVEIGPLTKSGRQWRSNDELAHLSSNLVWEKYFIKYEDILAANPRQTRLAPNMWQDLFFKWLPSVQIPDSDVAGITSQLAACLQTLV